jgi:hypothetical protein
MKYKCDVCHKVIEPGAGVVHTAILLPAAGMNDVEGFAIYPWSEPAIKEATRNRWSLGKIHKRCIGAQVQEYLKRFNMGRLVLPGAKVIITRKKMENRRANGRKVSE